MGAYREISDKLVFSFVMSGVVLIISIPSEAHEKCLRKKIKKKVVIDGTPEIMASCAKSDNGDFEKDFAFIGSKEFPLPLCRDATAVTVLPEPESMEKIIKSVLAELEIIDVTWRKSEDDNHYQIIFPIECGNKCEEILDVLKEHEIGTKLNSKISVMPCTIHYHGNRVNENKEEINEEDAFATEKKNSGWNMFVSSVKYRLTVAQVVENVKAKAAMTFDFIMLLLISSTLCALGLVENNNITMLSSMLISPMMGPVMAGTFGTVIRDKHLLKVGVQNEMIGLGIATLVGFCYGSVICVTTDKYGTTEWPTYEMYSRGDFRSLWVGAIIALLSGAAVALGILSDNIASLVGVAISTSLMPPAVNAGLLWSMGFVYYLKGEAGSKYVSLTHTDYFSTNSAVELTALGAVSICLTFVNIICIYFAGILVFKIKEVAPNTARDQTRRKFWKYDIRVARNYNRTVQSEDDFLRYENLTETKQSKKYDLNYYSTNWSKDQFQQNGNRKEYTWSPCCFVDELESKKPKRHNSSEYRRLSQIFPKPSIKKEDNLETVPEKSTVVDERTPLLSSTPEDPKGCTYLMSSGKKIIVTPCDNNIY